MILYDSEKLVKVRTTQSIMLEDCFDVHWPDGRISHLIDKSSITRYFAKTKKEAIKMHNADIRRRIVFFKEEINKLKRQIV